MRKKKMKLKIKNILILIVVIILTIKGCTLIFNKNETKKPTKKDTTSYSKESLNKMNDLNIRNKVDTKKYSKTLDVAIFSNDFNIDYITYYENIKYVDN